ncbi:ATP-binding protein [Streptomyces fulvoviolaceus]|uniref:ATP-binding protein n=1 Tax=Streptomyces fulvoviolaceus TaxID=285535 RepID=UPI0021C21145|nr:ATP-binding protein [Streptomyces fulvoviolaceus]MCT9083167.1 ATP-binding protein [Streptomyces fulvoviolaceus]
MLLPPPAPPRTARLSTVLYSDRESLRQARSITIDRLTAWGAEDRADTAVLLVNELVTNALVHAPGAVRLRLFLHSGLLRCEVADRHRTRHPHLCPVSMGRESGRGLRLVEAMALRWGSTPAPNGKDVWFELGLDGVPDLDGLDVTEAFAEYCP